MYASQPPPSSRPRTLVGAVGATKSVIGGVVTTTVSLVLEFPARSVAVTTSVYAVDGVRSSSPALATPFTYSVYRGKDVSSYDVDQLSEIRVEYTLCTVITGAVGGVLSASVVAVTVLLGADRFPALSMAYTL